MAWLKVSQVLDGLGVENSEEKNDKIGSSPGFLVGLPRLWPSWVKNSKARNQAKGPASGP